MRWRIPLAAALALFVAVSCDQQPVEPEPAETPLFNHGADVENEFFYTWPARFTWLDADPETEPADVLLIGYDPADDFACNDGVFVGGVRAKVHNVFKELGDDGERWVNVFSFTERPPLYMYWWADYPLLGTLDEQCDFLLNDWIAEGSWSVAARDNDVSCFDGTPGVNSYGRTENGRLEDGDGNKYKYSWKFHAICDPEADPVFKVTRSVDMVERK
jgi:hypothetical protein